MRKIESLLLNVERAQGFITLRISPDRINHPIKFFCPSDQFFVRQLRTLTRDIRHYAVQSIAHYDDRVAPGVLCFAKHFIHGKGQRIVEFRTTLRPFDGSDALAQSFVVGGQRRNHYLPTGKRDYADPVERARRSHKMKGGGFD